MSERQGSGFPFAGAAEAGFSFVFLRASVRVAMDARYVENRRRAREAGLLTGSHHYLYPQPAPEEQALACYQALVVGQGFGDELPPVLDEEQDDLWEARVRGFLEAFAELWERTVAIYTSRSKWHEVVGRDRAWAVTHPLWVADWGRWRRQDFRRRGRPGSSGRGRARGGCRDTQGMWTWIYSPGRRLSCGSGIERIGGEGNTTGEFQYSSRSSRAYSVG